MVKKTKDALELIARDVGRDRSFQARVAREQFNAQLAGLLYRARTSASLTQKELAALVGTSQPVIARLEDADYEGHSLAMLRRIATALGRRLELRFVSNRRAQAG